MPATRVLQLEERQEVLVQAFVEAADRGQLLIFPTDTVYGLGVRADSLSAVRRLYEAKGRPAGLPLPLLTGDRDRLAEVVSAWPEAAERLAAAFWPGPLTLVLARHPRVPALVTGGRDTVGVRMPAQESLLTWLQACPFPLAVSSANLSGEPEAVTVKQIPAEVLAAASLVLDGGPCPGGRPSTVVDLTGPAPRILRPGPISEDQIRECLRS